MEILSEVTFDSGTADCCFSLKKQRYTIIDGLRQNIGDPIRMAVTPLDIEEVQDFVNDGKAQQVNSKVKVKMPEHPIVTMLTGIWTDEVKETYKEAHKEEELINEQDNDYNDTETEPEEDNTPLEELDEELNHKK